MGLCNTFYCLYIFLYSERILLRHYIFCIKEHIFFISLIFNNILQVLETVNTKHLTWITSILCIVFELSHILNLCCIKTVNITIQRSVNSCLLIIFVMSVLRFQLPHVSMRSFHIVNTYLF